MNNFGDLLGPLLVERMLALYGIDPATARKDCQLMSVGSVLHFAHDSDVVWGSGVNGKAPAAIHRFHSLDVRAVRGPLTQAFLAQRGIHVPEIYGDPALLLPHVAPELFDVPARNVNEVTIVPNVNDYSRYAGDPRAVNPRAPMDLVLKRIAGSKFVAGSSLHGIVVAESLGIPARLIASEIEQAFKYEDYYLGTGRQGMEAAGSIEEAVALDGRDLPRFDREALLQAFPSDLWASPE